MTSYAAAGPASSTLEAFQLVGEPHAFRLDLLPLSCLRLCLSERLRGASHVLIERLSLGLRLPHVLRRVAQLADTLVVVLAVGLDLFHLTAKQLEQRREVRTQRAPARGADAFGALLFDQLALFLELAIAIAKRIKLGASFLHVLGPASAPFVELPFGCRAGLDGRGADIRQSRQCTGVSERCQLWIEFTESVACLFAARGTPASGCIRDRRLIEQRALGGERFPLAHHGFELGQAFARLQGERKLLIEGAKLFPHHRHSLVDQPALAVERLPGGSALLRHDPPRGQDRQPVAGFALTRERRDAPLARAVERRRSLGQFGGDGVGVGQTLFDSGQLRLERRPLLAQADPAHRGGVRSR